MKVKVETYLDSILVKVPYKEGKVWKTQNIEIYADKLDGVTVYVQRGENVMQLVTNWSESEEVQEELNSTVKNLEVAKVLHNILYDNYEQLDEEQIFAIVLDHLDKVKNKDV